MLVLLVLLVLLVILVLFGPADGLTGPSAALTGPSAALTSFTDAGAAALVGPTVPAGSNGAASPAGGLSSALHTLFDVMVAVS